MSLFFRTAILVIFVAVAAGSVTATFTSEAAERRGMPLRWRDAKVKIALSESLLAESGSIKPGSDLEGAISRSLEVWARATGIEFVEVGSEKLSVSPTGAAGDGVSLITIAPTQQNLAIFGHNPLEIPATTRIFFDRQGYITEADIVLNPSQQFSTDGTFGTYDLEAVLTHEIGHLIGLEHSLIPGSMMYRSQAKNGHFALMASPGRELSAVDLAAVRSTYGELDPDAECCYRIEGSDPGFGPSRTFLAWAEDPATGEVIASSQIEAKQPFALHGLAAGRYRVYLQGFGEGKHVSGSSLAEVSSRRPEYRYGKFPLSGLLPFEVDFVGTNGQLSKMPIVLESGKRYSVLLAGKRIDPDFVAPGSTSPFITVASVADSAVDYGNGLTAISFEIIVDPSAPAGLYTLFAADKAGNRSYFPGSLVVSAR